MAWCSQIFCHSPRAGRISWQPDGPAQERASDEEANGLVSVKLLVLTAGHIAICRPCVQLFTSRRTGCWRRKRVGLSIGCSGRSITSIWAFVEKNSPSFEAQARAALLFFKKKKQREPCGMCRFGRIWRRCCWVCRCGRNVHLIYGMRAYKFSHRHLPVAAPHFTQNNSRRRRLSAPDMIKMGRSKKKKPRESHRHTTSK